ncbi:MAG: hypothetical protein GY861_24080, partial [bacterium]|nr:hypothetical protein [bacterium]
MSRDHYIKSCRRKLLFKKFGEQMDGITTRDSLGKVPTGGMQQKIYGNTDSTRTYAMKCPQCGHSIDKVNTDLRKTEPICSICREPMIIKQVQGESQMNKLEKLTDALEGLENSYVGMEEDLNDLIKVMNKHHPDIEHAITSASFKPVSQEVGIELANSDPAELSDGEKADIADIFGTNQGMVRKVANKITVSGDQPSQPFEMGAFES